MVTINIIVVDSKLIITYPTIGFTIWRQGTKESGGVGIIGALVVNAIIIAIAAKVVAAITYVVIVTMVTPLGLKSKYLIVIAHCFARIKENKFEKDRYLRLKIFCKCIAELSCNRLVNQQLNFENPGTSKATYTSPT